MPRCKLCSTEYEIESTTAYEAAPGWDDECAACTRRKFEAYVNDYLLENFTARELALRVEGYFALHQGTISDQDDRNAISDFISISVLDQKLGEGGRACTTPGDAISQFVLYFDARLEHLEKVLSRRLKRSISKMCIAGAVIIGIVALVALLARYIV
ncbi:MAG: hypothetical protein Q6373_021630 [Candidatus Sigynarchaeota archaeon]